MSVSEEFKNNIKEWISIDDREKELKAQIKIITKGKKELSEKILKEMEDSKIDDLSLSTGGKLKANISTTIAPLKKEHIYTRLLGELNDELKANYLTNKIYDKGNRDTVTRITLKRFK